MNRAGLASPFGTLSLTEDDGVITRLEWCTSVGPPTPRFAEATPLLAEAIAQLQAYFDKRLTRFDLPLDWGRDLHQKTRRALAAIPFGETRTYGDLARALDAPAQAIGQACGANPVPILIPCHRVLARNGLGGFSARGGIETKVALLRHEGAAGLLI